MNTSYLDASSYVFENQGLVNIVSHYYISVIFIWNSALMYFQVIGHALENDFVFAVQIMSFKLLSKAGWWPLW
jgi:hypothetical protein